MAKIASPPRLTQHLGAASACFLSARRPGHGTAALDTDEDLHVRHHSLFVPSDFDALPCFEVVKPKRAAGFDHRPIEWADRPV